jgi:hypothetical protein
MIAFKFIFLGKIFTIAFILINFVTLIPLRLLEPNFYLTFSTTLLDTATLLLIGITVPRYLYLQELKNIEQLQNNNLIDSLDSDKLKNLQIKNFNSKKLTYYISIFFLIITLINPILLFLDINRNEIFNANIILSIEDNFIKTKSEIEELISTRKNNLIDKQEIKNLENRIINLSNTKDNRIANLLKINNQNKIASTKIVIRNFLLGLLWSIAFYKLYKI